MTEPAMLHTIDHVTREMDAHTRAKLCWQEMSFGNIARPANADEAVKFMTPHFERAMADAKERVRLPGTREGLTHHFEIFDATGRTTDAYITPNTYPDGRVGEIFVKIGQVGDAMGPILDEWAKMFSAALQFGAPLEVLCNMHRATRFEPSGATKNPEIPRTTSPLDYIARFLLKKYVTPTSTE